MSEEEKKRGGEAQITDERLEDVSGGGVKYGDITLKRGTFSTAETSDSATLTTEQNQAYDPGGVAHHDNWREQT